MQELFPHHLRASGRLLREKAGFQSTVKGWFSKRDHTDEEQTPEDIKALEVPASQLLRASLTHQTLPKPFCRWATGKPAEPVIITTVWLTSWL